MSEEKPRLSRREMREQGLLKVGREETPVSRDDLLTRTSELQLRRPTRREMRLQREANEAKVAEQSAKLNKPSPMVESQPEKSSESRLVHSFSLSGATPSAASEPAKQFPAPADAGTSAFDSDKNVKSEQDTLMKAPAVLGDSEVKKDEKPATSTGRSSVFDRFTSKDEGAISFRDRLVARTREGQREARENQPVLAVPSADASAEQSNDVAGFFGMQSNENEKDTVLQVEETTIEDVTVATDDKVEVIPAPATEPAAEPETEPAVEAEPAPVSTPTPEDTGNEDAQADTDANTTEEEGSQDDTLESKDSTKDSNAVAAVAEDGRYPTDVSMRLTDDDEEKTGGDRLVSLLIILVGVLIGVVVGLIVQNFIFGTQGIDMNPVYYAQAIADSYTIGS